MQVVQHRRLLDDVGGDAEDVGRHLQLGRQPVGGQLVRHRHHDDLLTGASSGRALLADVDGGDTRKIQQLVFHRPLDRPDDRAVTKFPDAQHGGPSTYH
ncbi:hypothetical protein ACFQ0O_36000 [Saccharopolyspora spinosporotrichia]